jgi:hypothetical protein
VWGAGTERGLFFFGRFELTENRTAVGTPIFQRTPQEQFQHPVGKVALSWTQPGVYYIGLFGAWTGDTMHTSLLDPVDGIKTQIFPQLAGTRQFQPLALVVPWENGTAPALPAGFAGQSHALRPIVGDKRLAFTKERLTFFDGAHFYLPMQMPASYDGPPTLAVDVDLPAGCTLVSGAGTHVQPLAVASVAAAAGRHRVRVTGTKKGDAAARLGAAAGVGVRFGPQAGLVGAVRNVSFRARTVPNASSEAGTAGWLVMAVAIVARPAFRTPVHLSTGLSYGCSLPRWPSAADGSWTNLSTYAALALNTVPTTMREIDAANGDWLLPSQRQSAQWAGLKYGPQSSAWGGTQGALAMAPAAVDAANLSARCPGAMSPAQATLERRKWRRAAEFHAELTAQGFSNPLDMGYDGCIRKQDVVPLLHQIARSQPDVVIYDVEEWPDLELWTTHVGLSKNALRQRRPDESDAALAGRVRQQWWDDLLVPTKAKAPGTVSAFWGGHAADNRGCCSGGSQGTFEWAMLQASGCWSYPGYYSAQKNPRMLAQRLRRERAALPRGWMLLPTLTPMGAIAFSGGVQRSEYLFDVMVQLLANGATGLSIFEDSYTDDPGTYLALAEAISLAVPYEDVIINGTACGQQACDCVSVEAGDSSSKPSALASAMRHASGVQFIAVTPAVAWMHHGADRPKPELVKFTITVATGFQLKDLRKQGVVTECDERRLGLEDREEGELVRECALERSLSSSAVYAIVLSEQN